MHYDGECHRSGQGRRSRPRDPFCLLRLDELRSASGAAGCPAAGPATGGRRVSGRAVGHPPEALDVPAGASLPPDVHRPPHAPGRDPPGARNPWPSSASRAIRSSMDGAATDARNTIYRDLAERLHRHRLATLRLSRGITIPELDRLVTLLSGEPVRERPRVADGRGGLAGARPASSRSSTTGSCSRRVRRARQRRRGSAPERRPVGRPRAPGSRFEPWTRLAPKTTRR